MSVPQVKLNNGLEMPGYGLGTYKGLGDVVYNAVSHAIDVGYRHVDTAFLYQNEQEVGKAIRDKIAEGVVTREEIFVTTKLWSTFFEPDKIIEGCKKSLKSLGLDYIDLYLMHYPFGLKYFSDDLTRPLIDENTLDTTEVDYLDVWKKIEECVKLGLVKSIGVSNFNSEQIDRLLANCTIKPVNNQVECSININQRKLIKFCKDRDIVVSAYSPLGRSDAAKKTPKFLFDEKVAEIGKKYGKTPAQIALRFLVEIETVPLPKSVTPKRIEENLKIFDFKLSDEDLDFLISMETGERVTTSIQAKHHKFWPFNLEF